MLNRISPLFLILCFFLFPAYDPAESYHYPIEGNFALSGTFGELRPNHFHSGIDIKTYRRTGFKIFAAQEGYLYRIKVSPYSYGKALYMRHPDGRFSVYAHLSKFIPEIEDFVRERQEKNELFEQEIYLEKDRFYFKRGQIIGYSGNSGNSFGPHLHFELRDPTERILNALPYFDALVKDNIKPILKKVSFEPIGLKSRVEGKYAKHLVIPTGSDGQYKIEKTIQLNGKVGLEYLAIDKLNAAPNRCGINYARLYLDGKLHFSLELDVFAFDETHNINMHMDYGHYVRKRERLQKAYIDEGNRFSAYGQMVNQGFIELQDHAVHPLKLELEDAHGNVSVLEAHVQRRPEQDEYAPEIKPNAQAQLNAYVQRNALIVEGRNFKDMLFCEKKFGEPLPIFPAYFEGSVAKYLIPLDQINYPQEIRDPAGTVRIKTHLIDYVAPSRNELVAFEEVQAYFPHDALFHPVHLNIEEVPAPKGAYSKAYQVGEEKYPVRERFWLSFQQSWPDALAEHLVIAKLTKKGWRYSGNKLGEDGRVYGTTGEFGTFCVMMDSTAPVMRALNFSDGATIATTTYSIHLKLEDTFSGIQSKSIRATLDGEWVPFEYNFKVDQISSRWQKRPSKGRHILEIEVKDGAGNLVKKKYDLVF
jgi:murein DD-endopeptidase MepM/ murein hydrolase activator NlpD